MADITLRTARNGDPVVTVDGVELHGVTAASVLTAHGEIPRLLVDLRDDVEVEIEGIVERTMPADGNEIAEWLSAISPDELGRAALANADMTTSPPAAMLAQLIEWARAGEEPGR